MLKELWDRVLLPLLIPLAALAVIVVVVLNFSRVLLALHATQGATAATMVALLVSAAVLFGFTYFSARGEERSNANVTALVGAGMVLIFAGFTGFAAIEAEHEKEEHAAEPELGEPVVVARAFDIGWRETELTAPAGRQVIGMVNEGNAVHTFLIESVPGFKLEVSSSGDEDKGEVELEPGSFVFFCDIPGHRQAGMEGTLTVTEGGGAPAGGEQTGGPEGQATGGSRAEFVAKDIFFEPEELTVPSAPVQISLRNEGNLNHTLLVDGVPRFRKLEVPTKGATASGTLEAEPGEYVVYCDVPGHRAAGMEATLRIG